MGGHRGKATNMIRLYLEVCEKEGGYCVIVEGRQDVFRGRNVVIGRRNRQNNDNTYKH